MSDTKEPVDEHAQTLPWQGDPVVTGDDFANGSDRDPSGPSSGRPRKQARLFVAATLLIAGGALTYLVIGGVEQNLVYYLTPSELLAKGEEGVWLDRDAASRCSVTAMREDRTRLNIVVDVATTGRLVCFSNGEEACRVDE